MTNATGAEDFAVQLQDYLRRELPENVAKAQSTLAFEAIRAIMDRSPVGNPSLWKGPAPFGYVGGQFRGNWQLTLNQTTDATLSRIDPTGSASLQDADRALANIKAFDSVHIQNNLPYAIRLEEGWSTEQAPQGMVALTVADLRDAIVEVK
jgi:hypothetical protein